MPAPMDTETAYNQALDYLYSYVDYSLKKSAELAKAHFRAGAHARADGSPGRPAGYLSYPPRSRNERQGSTSAADGRRVNLSRVSDRAVYLASPARITPNGFKLTEVPSRTAG